MILPKNIIAYLNDLFLSSGMTKEEVEKQLQILDFSLRINLTVQVLKKISQDKQKQIIPKIKQAKTADELLKFLAVFFKDNLTKKQIEKIYQEELEKILEPILKPLKESCTTEQLAKLQKVTAKYF